MNQLCRQSIQLQTSVYIRKALSVGQVNQKFKKKVSQYHSKNVCCWLMEMTGCIHKTREAEVKDSRIWKLTVNRWEKATQPLLRYYPSWHKPLDRGDWVGKTTTFKCLEERSIVTPFKKRKENSKSNNTWKRSFPRYLTNLSTGDAVS